MENQISAPVHYRYRKVLANKYRQFLELPFVFDQDIGNNMLIPSLTIQTDGFALHQFVERFPLIGRKGLTALASVVRLPPLWILMPNRPFTACCAPSRSTATSPSR